MALPLDDYAKRLAGLKKSYLDATTDQQRSDIQNQGQQTRSQAFGAGIDLNQLEDAANASGGFQVDRNDPNEQAFRQQTFDAVKAAPVINFPTVSATGQVGGNTSSGQVGQTNMPVRYNNQYLSDAGKLMTQLQQIVNTPFSFNPYNSPTYQAAQQLAQQGAKTATQKTLETMNNRGIINSSVTSNQLGQIEQQAQAEPLKLIPQLEANAMQQKQQQAANLSGLAGTLLNAGQNQQHFDAQLPMQEAALTGKYLPGEAKGLIDQILQLKQAAESPFVTSGQLSQYKNAADGLRAQLSTFGVDPNLFGFDQNYEQAAANVPQAGQITTDAQKTLMNTLLGINNNYGQLQAGTADAASQLPMFSGVSGLLQGLEGKNNLKGDQAQLQRDKFNLDQTNVANQMMNRNQATAISQGNLGVSQGNLALNNQKFTNEKQSQQATAGWATQVLNAKDRDEALGFINEYGSQMAQEGADINKILVAVDAKFTKPSNGNTPKSLSPVVSSIMSAPSKEEALNILKQNASSLSPEDLTQAKSALAIMFPDAANTFDSFLPK